MMSEQKQQPTASARPWYVDTTISGTSIRVKDRDDLPMGRSIAVCTVPDAEASADHIVLCVNSHDQLVVALQEAAHYVKSQPATGSQPRIVKCLNAALALAGEKE